MTENSTETPESAAFRDVTYAILLGAIALLVGSLALICLGLALWLALLTSIPLPVAVFCLFMRRKRQLRVAREVALTHAAEVDEIARRLDYIYAASPVAVLTVEIVDWTVRRASRGFYNLLGMDLETKLVGTRLAALLKVKTAQMDALEAHLGDSSTSKSITLACIDSEGRALNLLVNGWVLEEGSVVELVFVPDVGEVSSDHEFAERAEEMEVFRKMMMRRESRILELKSEVNQLMIELRRAPTYEIDSATTDKRIQELTQQKTQS